MGFRSGTPAVSTVLVLLLVVLSAERVQGGGTVV